MAVRAIEIGRVEPALESLPEDRPFTVEDREPAGVAVAALVKPWLDGTGPRSGSRGAAPGRAR